MVCPQAFQSVIVMNNDSLPEIGDQGPAMVGDKLDIRKFFENSREYESHHSGRGVKGPAEYGEYLIVGDRFGSVIGLAGTAHRVDPDGQIETGT